MKRERVTKWEEKCKRKEKQLKEQQRGYVRGTAISQACCCAVWEARHWASP